VDDWTFFESPATNVHKQQQKTQLQKTITIQYVNTDQNLQKKSASKDQIRILAHEKQSKEQHHQKKNK